MLKSRYNGGVCSIAYAFDLDYIRIKVSEERGIIELTIYLHR